jgi:hypothetical protein
MHPLRIAALAVAAASLPALGAPAAVAATGRGLSIVTSHAFTLPAGQQARGTVKCAAGTAPFGGGGLGAEGTSISINGSFPTARGWTVDMNNASATASTFRVVALCGRRPPLYSLASSGFLPLPAGRTPSAFASCPSGSFPLGGGSDTSSGQTSVNLLGSLPFNSFWRADEANLSPLDAAYASVATCGAPKGYLVQSNGPIELSPHTETLVAAGCPGSRVAAGGGVLADPGVTVNSTGPDVIRIFWDNELNNTTDHTLTATAWVVCVHGTPPPA